MGERATAVTCSLESVQASAALRHVTAGPAMGVYQGRHVRELTVVVATACACAGVLPRRWCNVVSGVRSCWRHVCCDNHCWQTRYTMEARLSTSPEGRHHRSNSRDTTLLSTFDTMPLWPCTRTAHMDTRIIYPADKRCSCSHCIVPPLHHHAATLHMPRLPPCMMSSGSVAQTRKSLAC